MAISIATPTIPGTPFAGGFFVDRFQIDGTPYALIVAPKSVGDLQGQRWNKGFKRVAGALSFADGLGNTHAMAAVGSELAKTALALRIGGFDDWHVPARDELELLYRIFKPTEQENWCYRGDNPSSLPPRFAYMPDDPAQTAIEAFKAGGAEAFEPEAYWSSTQYAGNDAYAWSQIFVSGHQLGSHKDNELLARAVRRVPIQ